MKLFANFRPMEIWEIINSVEHPCLSVDASIHLYDYQRLFIKRMCRKDANPECLKRNLQMAIWNIPINLN